MAGIFSAAIAVLFLAGIAGLAVGSLVNAVIDRVPIGTSLAGDGRCGSCQASTRPRHGFAVLSWVARGGRCGSCGAPLPARYPLVEAGTCAGFVALTWWFIRASDGSAGTVGPATWPVLAAYLYLLALSVALTVIDVGTHRLPNVLVLPSYLVALTLFALACALGSAWEDLLRGVVGMTVLYGFYLALRLVRPGGMGGGDVKLAGVLGLYLGWLGWGSLAVGAFAAFFFGGVFGLALMAFGRAGRRTAIPFGPWMIAGAWAGILAGGPLGEWYIGRLGGA